MHIEVFGAQDPPVELRVLDLVLAEVALRVQGRAAERGHRPEERRRASGRIATRVHQQSPLRATQRGPGRRPRAAPVGKTSAAMDGKTFCTTKST